MRIIELEKEEYKNKPITVCYKTDCVYEITERKSFDEFLGFDFKLVKLNEEKEFSFDDVMLADWLDSPVAFGAFEDDELLGFIEGFHEKWNNRFRISNICVFDYEKRAKGTGTALIQFMLKKAKECGARMSVLETQSSNVKAINFYSKNGFKIIGFDLYAYSNDDFAKRQNRIEMGKLL